MNELIKINWSNIGDSECRTVDARELWYFLETKYRFTEWIKQRIHTYEFVAGTDYEVFRESPINQSGGRPQDNYHITINMAKQLCMVENNDRGKQARQYFIACEDQLKRFANGDVTKLEALEWALESEKGRLAEIEKNKILTKKIEQDKPDVEFSHRFQHSEGNMKIAGVAQMLGTGQNRLWEYMREQKIIKATDRFEPYQQYFDAGYFAWKLGTHEEKGKMKSHRTLLVTPSGRQWLWKRWNNYIEQPEMMLIQNR